MPSFFEPIFANQRYIWENKVTPITEYFPLKFQEGSYPYYTEKGVFSGYTNANEFGNRLLTTATLAIAGCQFTADCLLNVLSNVISLAHSINHLDRPKGLNSISAAIQNLTLAVCAAIHTIAVTAWQLAATFIKLIPTLVSSLAPVAKNKDVSGEAVEVGVNARQQGKHTLEDTLYYSDEDVEYIPSYPSRVK